MRITVRKALPEDAVYLPDVERSAGQTFLAIPDLAWIADDTVMTAEQHLVLIAEGTVWVVEEESGKILGFLSAERIGRELHIWELSVVHERQGEGLGKQLVRVALNYGRQHEFSAATLTTFRNVGWNDSFYAALGFSVIDSDHLTARLKDVLEDERQAGIPVERRCAMIFLLAPV